MPGYNNHRIFNYLIFIAIFYILFSRNIVQFSPWSLIAIGTGFYLGTEFITPDLDTNSTAHKRWGRLRILMIPYKWLFKHRNTSHDIFYGAVVRILYIGIILLGFYYLIFRTFPSSLTFSPVYVFIFLFGIISANALHVILDKCL